MTWADRSDLGMPDSPTADFGVHLVRVDDRTEEIAALSGRWGDRVGLAGVLAALNRSGRVERVPARAATWGFRLDEEDDRSRRWWPQGITTSADAHPTGLVAGRSVVLTSAYSKEINDVHMGARITLSDVSDASRVRYRHVLLVEAVESEGALELRPVKVHAGGLVWHGRHLHVAGTARGLSTFRLDDILEVPPGGSRTRLSLADGGRAYGGMPGAFGYRYVLPLRFRYAGEHAAAVAPVRYSFISLDRTTTPHRLMAGEYGRGEASTRIVRFEVDPRSSLLAGDWVDRSRPLGVEIGISGMQGVVVVDGRHYVSTSAGAYRRGSLWSGHPGSLQQHPGVLTVGPEDLAYQRSSDQLWSLSEYPNHRYVYAMDRARFD